MERLLFGSTSCVVHVHAPVYLVWDPYIAHCIVVLYRIAQKFRGSKFSRIAVFENFVEKISRIHCPKHATPTLFVGVTCWNSTSRALELSFIDLAAAVNTRNLEGMPTFDVQAYFSLLFRTHFQVRSSCAHLHSTSLLK